VNSVARKLVIWVYSLIAATIGGIGTSVGAVVTGQMVGALNFTPRQLGAIAVGGAVSAAAAYLAKSPLPKLDEGDGQ
jgi:hypothetical protein